MSDEIRDSPTRDGWVGLGLAISAVSAALASFESLRGLAIVAGWPVVLAPLLPCVVDAYAATATRVWLAASTRSARARTFARANAIGAILLSLTGNAVYHLIVARLVLANWIVVVAVGAVPALVLGLVSHLAVLRSRVDVKEPDPVRPGVEPVRTDRPAVRTEAGPRYASDDDQMVAARAADVAHRAAHGRAISRDGLRQALHISGARATVLARRLKEEREAGKPVVPNKGLGDD